MKNTSTSTKPVQPKIELLPPSITLRVGRRRLTLSWRPRKQLPSLLSSLLRRSWRQVLAPVLKVSVATAAVCGAWQTQALAAAPAPGTLPAGWNVVNGNVTFTQNGNTLNINQLSPKAIAEFASFSIGSGAVVDISQPSAAAAFLAKVTGADISQIYGKLTAPGTVVLFNPNGVLVGAGGVVDVGRFVASTLNINNDDFLAGKLTFAKDRATVGSVENYGNITSATGGSVYLIGSSVTNGGIIKSPQGEVILAAGQTVTLADTATPGVTVNVTGSTGDVTNLGTITAEAGRIGIAAGLITNSGNISASSVVREGGRIFLRASSNLTTTANSSITADGTVGGNITLFANNKAFIDGDVSAAGAPGQGGFIETSGLGSLDVVKVPTVGSGGTWYIDPYDIEVVAGSLQTGASGSQAITSIGSSAKIGADLISSQLNGGSSVTLSTGVGGTQAGNISINSAINKVSCSTVSLTLEAHNNIFINADIIATSGPLNLTLHSNYQGTGSASSYTAQINNASVQLHGGKFEVFEGTSNSFSNLAINGTGSVILGSYGSMQVHDVNVASNANFSMVGAGVVNLTGTLTNAGTTNVTSTTDITLANLANSGTFQAGGYANLNLTNGMTNSGTFNVSSGASIAANGQVTNTVSGNINIGSACGTAAISGSGTWVNNGNMTIGASGFALEFQGGGIDNRGTLTVTNSYQTLDNLINSASGKLVTSNGAQLTMANSTMNGALQINAGTQLNLRGATFGSGFSANGTGAMNWSGDLVLAGAVVVGASAPTITLDQNPDSEAITSLRAKDGNSANTLTTYNTVNIQGGQYANLNTNTTWNNAGILNVGSGKLTMVDHAQLVNQAGGTINMSTGYMTGGTGTRLVNSAGATLNMIDNSSGSSIGGSSLDETTLYLDNYGIVNSHGLNSAGLKNNTGGQVNVVAGCLTVNKATNEGSINISGSSNLIGLNSNDGNITVAANSNMLGGNAYVLNNQGTITLAGGSVSYEAINNSGVVLGSGTFSTGESGFNNSGTVAPGGDGAIGSISFTGGSFRMLDGGKLLIDVAGTGNGQYDTINAQNGLSLGGTLQTKAINGYTPVIGDSYAIFGVNPWPNGYFRNVEGTIYNVAGSKAMIKAIRGGEGAFSLQMRAGEDFTASGVENDWSSLDTWGGMTYLPTAVDRVTITGGSVVTESGVDVVDQLTVNTGSTLRLSGGNLTVNGASSIAGIVNVNDGSLALNGLLNGDGAINVGGYLNYGEGGEGEGFNGFTVAPTYSPAKLTIASALSKVGVRVKEGGDLSLTGSVGIADLEVSGGNVTGIAGSKLNVSESYTQGSGNVTLADAALSQAAGTLSVGNITATNLVLEAQTGDISQQSGSALHVTKQLLASASTGIDLSASGNQIAALAAANRGTGNITVVNTRNAADTSVVTFNGISTAAGSISVDNTGAAQTAELGAGADFLAGLPSNAPASTSAKLGVLGITNSSGKVSGNGGNVSVVTHSPLTIGAGGVSASGSITLVAGASSGSNDILTINGLISSLGGNITLSAGDGMTINANISTSPPGIAVLSVLSGGVIGYAQGVTITDANGVRTPVGSNSLGQTLALAQQQQNTQTQNLQATINGAQLSAGTQSTANAVQQTSSGANQTTGGTSGTFGDEGENKQPGKKPLPMCT